MKTDYDILIIGAGVIGLSTAYQLAGSEKKILVVEEKDNYGKGISSRNSEVVHSGIYYPEGSYKHRLCIRGRELLKEFCSDNNVWYNECGKLIVAQDNQIDSLNTLYDQSIKNKIYGVKELNSTDIKNYNSLISARAALFISCTSIFSSHDFMNKLYSYSYNNNHDYLFKSSIIDVNLNSYGYEIIIKNAFDDIEKFTCRTVINCAGLSSDIISKLILKEKSKTPEISFSKGCYFKLSSKWNNVFKSLIYPIPDLKNQTLGIHLTIDRDGNARLGPDAKIVYEKNYNVDESTLESFYIAARTYIPTLKKNDLTPDYAGIRPKIKNTSGKFSDFYINEEVGSGLQGWFNLIGIESPGLTSSLAIGEKISQMLISRTEI